MHEFEYAAPTTLGEALDLLSQHQQSAKLLAGGTDLIDQMRTGRFRPQFVIDVKKIAELNALYEDDTGLHIGAAVPCCQIQELPVARETYSALVDSCQILGGIQIQSRASVGGNLCNASPAADSIPSLIALRATCTIAGPQGTRVLPVAEFCTGPGQNGLAVDELLVEMHLPKPAERTGSHYRRVIPRNEMDIAVVGVGASIQVDESGNRITSAAVGLGAVAPVPLLAHRVAESLVDQPINAELFEQAGQIARECISPISDMRGTSEYRTHVTGVLVRRVLQAAVVRARGESLQYCPGH
ncbi:MAG: xanthine dehydrogenase family protein subunit M [Planctomycetales bacterium]|nr:xanthine dehydrogenase family protein subunit M [Planctomycetales bacterium]